MASKRFHNFVKSKVNPITLTKLKNKSDTEEPLIFENLDSEEEPNEENIKEDIKENIIVSEKLNVNTNNITLVDENIESSEAVLKSVDDFDVVICPNESSVTNTANVTGVTNPIRSKVENIGKSVNTALKDAHFALNAIMKDKARHKVLRKPSEFVKRSRLPTNPRKKLGIIDDEGKNETESVRSKSLPREQNLEITDVQNADSVDQLFDQSEIGKLSNDKFESVANEPINELEIEENRETEIIPEPVTTLESEIVSKQSRLVDNNVNNTESLPINLGNLKLVGLVGAFISIFFIFSISKFILGLLCGLLMSFGIFKLYESFFINQNDEIVNDKRHPVLRNYPSPIIPHIEERGIKDEYASPKSYYSTWVNAVNSYHPSWNNLAVSYSLHVSLDGTKLRMRKPKGKVPVRSLWNDAAITNISFLSERTVDLLHSKVHLLPYGLVRRRLWSKKYPICITINTDKTDCEKNQKPIQLPHSKSAESLIKSSSNEENIFFFTRTCREKEEMFRRLMAASLGMPINLTITDIVEKYLAKELINGGPIELSHVSETKQEGEDGKTKDESVNTKSGFVTKRNPTLKEPQIVTYVRYMAKFMPSDSFLLKAKSQDIDLNYVECDSELLWLNALIGRIAWDVFRGSHWIKVIREKIRKKLKKLHLPYFIDQLEVIDIDLGSELPVIRKVSRPYLDYRGLWVEFEVVYAGGFSMGLETKMNLLKLKRTSASQRSGHNKQTKSDASVKYIREFSNPTEAQDINNNEPNEDIPTDFNSELKMELNVASGGGTVSSLASDEDKTTENLSSDESFPSGSDSDASVEKFSADCDNETSLSQPTSNKSLMQWVDKIARSTYFQKAADNKYVLKTMEYVSNTSLVLQVDAHYLNGTLVVNIPPPPSDRLWWGFKKDPDLHIKARPKVGQKEIQMTKIVEFIEKKLIQEFRRVAVLPNMDDLTIPLLHNGNPENYCQNLL